MLRPRRKLPLLMGTALDDHIGSCGTVARVAVKSEPAAENSQVMSQTALLQRSAPLWVPGHQCSHPEQDPSTVGILLLLLHEP